MIDEATVPRAEKHIGRRGVTEDAAIWQLVDALGGVDENSVCAHLLLTRDFRAHACSPGLRRIGPFDANVLRTGNN